MYNQNMQQVKKKNTFKNAIIFVIVGALLIIAGGTANTIHRHISLGSTIDQLEEAKKDRVSYINRTKKDIAEEETKNSTYSSSSIYDGKTRLEYLKENLAEHETHLKSYTEPNLSNAKIGQIYNIIGLVVSIVGAITLIVFLIMRKKNLFKIGLFISGGFLVVASWLFLKAFEGMFINFFELEHDYISEVYQYGGKMPVFIHPWLRFLYIALIFAGWIMIFVAFRNAKKNADTIIAEAQQAKQMKMQQAQMQQQFIQPQYQQAPQQYAQPTQQPQYQQPQYQQASQQVQPSQVGNRQQ